MTFDGYRLCSTTSTGKEMMSAIGCKILMGNKKWMKKGNTLDF